MIPVLFGVTATCDSTNGLGRLTDAISCIVEENRNGSYELTMTYPVTGQHFDDIAIREQVYTTAFKGSGPQAFRIYKISKPLNGVVTINAQHISYDLKRIVCDPFTGSTCSAALVALKAAMKVTNSFTFWTDKSVTANFSLTHPENARNILGGQSGSILDVYGTGEYEFDNYAVKLWLHRGSDKGVTIRYGKNLTDIKAEMDAAKVYTTIVPYWVSQDGETTVYGGAVYSEHETEVPGHHMVAMDFSADFTDEPTVAQLTSRAAAYMEDNSPWEISENLTVSFVALADTEEYKDVASLETVNLCDTVHIYHPKLGITASAKVIRTKWDSLRERYTEIELGTAQTNLAQAIAPVSKSDLKTAVTKSTSWLSDNMQELIDNLTGVSGGYIQFKTEADGHISEIYAMDTDDASTATNILRINKEGIYCSTDGINGTYNLAITIDGQINASRILTGILQGIQVIADTGQIGEYEITSSGLQKEVTIDGVQWRVVMRPPNTTSGTGTWIISTQYYDTDMAAWRAVGYITAEGSAAFYGDYFRVITDTELHTAVETHSGDESHSGALTLTGDETHSGAETHSGTETHSGAVTMANTANEVGVGTLRYPGTMAFYINGVGYASANVGWGFIRDAYGNAGYVPWFNPSSNNTEKIGTIVSGTAITTSVTNSWTDNMSFDLEIGTWLVCYGCQITGVGAITLRLSSDTVNHRASCYSPDTNTYNVNGVNIVKVTTAGTYYMESWSAALTTMSNPTVKAIKIA